MYARISRLKLNDLLMQFDYPDANVHAEKRSVTTTPMQKLFVLNSPFMQRQASALAARLQGGAESDEDAHRPRLPAAFCPRTGGLRSARSPWHFCKRPSDSEMTRWEQYAQTLLASNEMLYVD